MKKQLTNKQKGTAIMGAINLALVVFMVFLLLAPGISVASENVMMNENLSPAAWLIGTKGDEHSYATYGHPFENAKKMNLISMPLEFFEAGEDIQESIDALNALSGATGYDSDKMTSLYVARYGCTIVGILLIGLVVSAVIAVIRAAIDLVLPLFGNEKEKKTATVKSMPSVALFVEFYAILVVAQIFVFGAFNSLGFGTSFSRYRILIDGGFHPLGVIIAVILIYVVAKALVDRSQYSTLESTKKATPNKKKSK